MHLSPLQVQLSRSIATSHFRRCSSFVSVQVTEQQRAPIRWYFFYSFFFFFFCYISSLLFSIFLVTRLRCPLFILPPPLPPRYEEMRLGFDIPMEFSPNRRFPQPPPTGNSATRNAFSTQCAIYVFRSSRRVARRVRPSARAKG